MEKKIHLEVSELETKLKDAHMIIEIEDDCKKNLENWRKCWNIQRKELENERKEMEIKKFELGWRCDGFFNQLPSLNNSVGL